MGGWFQDPDEILTEQTIEAVDAAALAAVTTNGTLTTPTLSGVVKLTTQTVGTTAPSAGAGDALPDTPAGYLTITINAVSHKIAYY